MGVQAPGADEVSNEAVLERLGVTSKDRNSIGTDGYRRGDRYEPEARTWRYSKDLHIFRVGGKKTKTKRVTHSFKSSLINNRSCRRNISITAIGILRQPRLQH